MVKQPGEILFSHLIIPCPALLINVTIIDMRRPRYIRQPDNLPHRLTVRDIEILQLVDRFKYLTSKQLADLLTSSQQAINKRLKLLFHHHSLGKLPALLSPKLFNSPDVYFIKLDRKAAKLLSKRGVTLPHQRRYNQKQVKREHLQHTLMTNDILISFELASRKDPNVEFLPSHKLLEGTKRLNHTHPWKVSAFLPEHNISRTAYPDAAVGLLNQKTGKTQLYLIEADRNTMPLARNDKKLFRVSNIKSKILIYHTAWQQGVFRERLGFPATRILFVTLSAERAQHMQELADDILGGSAPRLFIFTDKDNLSPTSSFWQQILAL